jgi:hypothetical protein
MITKKTKEAKSNLDMFMRDTSEAADKYKVSYLLAGSDEDVCRLHRKGKITELTLMASLIQAMVISLLTNDIDNITDTENDYV